LFFIFSLKKISKKGTEIEKYFAFTKVQKDNFSLQYQVRKMIFACFTPQNINFVPNVIAAPYNSPCVFQPYGRYNILSVYFSTESTFSASTHHQLFWKFTNNQPTVGSIQNTISYLNFIFIGFKYRLRRTAIAVGPLLLAQTTSTQPSKEDHFPD
jgi:hypothetical protein